MTGVAPIVTRNIFRESLSETAQANEGIAFAVVTICFLGVASVLLLALLMDMEEGRSR